MVTSAVSPDLRKIAVLRRLFGAREMIWSVWVRVPIWSSVITIALLGLSAIPLSLSGRIGHVSANAPPSSSSSNSNPSAICIGRIQAVDRSERGMVL
jgi:hypothetical protein